MLQHLAGARLENSPGLVVSLPTMRSATRYEISVVPIVRTLSYLYLQVQSGGWDLVQDGQGRLGPIAQAGSQWVGYDDITMIR